MPVSASVTATVLPALPSLRTQADRLIESGVHEIAGLSAAEVRAAAATPAGPGALLAVHPQHAPASVLAPLLRHDGRPGFVVTDMTDADLFAPLDTIALPDAPLYVLTGLDRGDRMANWSPERRCPRSPRRSAPRCCSARASTGCCNSPPSWSATTAS